MGGRGSIGAIQAVRWPGCCAPPAAECHVRWTAFVDTREIAALVSGQLLVVPPELHGQLKRFVCPAFRADRVNPYKTPPREQECWVVAQSSTHQIVYSQEGLAGSDPWAITSPGENELPMDSCWHVSLKDAFINSPLCPLDLVPEGYEVP